MIKGTSVPSTKMQMAPSDSSATPFPLRSSTNSFKKRVVERLAPLFYFDSQAVVDFVELLPARVANLVPPARALLRAALEANDRLLGSLLEIGLAVKPHFRILVQPHQVADRSVGRYVFLLHVLDEHPKLGAPVPDVIQPLHLDSRVLERPREGVSNNSGAQVTHVHLLRHVRGREVNHCAVAAWLRCPALNPAAARTKQCSNLLLQQSVLQFEVDETWPGYAHLLKEIVRRNGLKYGRGHLPRIRWRPLRPLDFREKRHGVVALVVTKLRVCRRDDHDLLPLLSRERGSERVA
mmetsp:Transcript_11071/g.20854  ORF Transcript_11071/g.20854 Transcript_11071/m.20854 type:complete len:294 (+) Transcript_11071:835-1716(+)